MSVIKLGNRLIGESNPTLIIAEIGINHQGDINIAKQLIDKAHDCGADAVKFQKRSISRILTKKGLDQPYLNRNSFGATYGEHKKALELSEKDYHLLMNYSEKRDLIFCASGWDEESIDFLDSIGMIFFKMASADLTNFPLLEHTAAKGKPMILSTGMASIDMVKKAYSLVSGINDQVALLQCTSTYPSSFDEIHLNVLSTYLKKFPDAVVGYSGHELGIVIPPVAVALGARIIERHFTLDRTMKGGDHAASLEPQGFSKMIRDIRHIERALGSDIKEVQKSELPIFKKLSKSIVLLSAVKKGKEITRDILTTKGPGDGISPMRISEVIGSIASRDIDEDEILRDGEML